MNIRHIDLVAQDEVYRTLSDIENYWYSRAEAIMDGANEGVSLAVCERYEAQARAKRVGYLRDKGITLGNVIIPAQGMVF
jgi:hypothetical protein